MEIPAIRLEDRLLTCVKSRLVRAIVVACLILTGSAEKSRAQVQDAFQWWLPVSLDFPVVSPKIRGYVESNPRLNDGLDGIDQYLFRSALGYKLRKNIEIGQGYVYVNNYNPERLQESRSFQQLGVGHVLFNRVQVLHRIRNEQRFIEYQNECANRLRYLLRLVTPIPNTRWYVLASDEIFINLNTVDSGPTRGIDQNRFFTGLGRQISKRYRMEVGYQYQYVNRTDPTADKGNHQLITQAFISL